MLTFNLELQTIDDAVLRQNVQHAKRQGCSFMTLNVLREHAEQVYWLHQECRKRQPPVETRQQPQDYTVWLDTFTSPRMNPELYHVLSQGTTYIGVSCLVKTEQNDVFTCGFTGIAVSHTGQRLALALKSQVLLTAKKVGIKHLVTHVRADNTAMLTVNRMLGFIPCDVALLPP